MTSRHSRSGSSPDDSSAPRTSSTTPGVSSWRAERLTDSDRRSHARKVALPLARPAGMPGAAPRRRAAMMSPVSSARGMNSPGRIISSSCCQRASASTPTIVPRCQLERRLVVHAELVAVERPPQGRLRSRAAVGPGPHRRSRRPRSSRGPAPWPGTWPRRRRAAASRDRRRGRRRPHRCSPS